MERIPTRKKRNKNVKAVLKRNFLGWLFLLVPLMLFAFFVWVPMGENVLLSFFSDYSFSQAVGFENYASVFGDSSFLAALRNTFLYIAYSLVLGYLIPIILGYLLSECIHAKGLFRVLLYLPCMISGIAVVFLFRSLYGDDDSSILNIIMVALGGTSQMWKSNTSLIIPLIVLAMTWRGAGSTALIYLSAFQGIDNSIYEASRLDGATPFQRFWRLTIPSLKGTFLMLLSLQIISVFQVFYEPLVIGNWGGPLDSSLSLMLLSYKYAYSDFEYGKSAATAVILSLIILAFTIVYFLLKRHLEREEKGMR